MEEKNSEKKERKMRDSGIPWIGEVPEGWGMSPLKYNYNIIAGATPDSTKQNFWDGNIKWITPADYKTKDVYVSFGKRNLTSAGYKACSTHMLPKGSIVISKRAPIGSVAITTSDLCTNQGCLGLVAKNKFVNNKYFYYGLSIYDDVLNLYGSGTTFKEISANVFSNIEFPSPSVTIQNSIADFLDSKCSEIDTLIENLCARVESAKEYKKAVVTEAVTKGLDKDAKMKDSGVDWIGKIPEKWKVSRIGHDYNVTLGKMLDSKEYDQHEMNNYLCAANIKWSGVNTSINKKMKFSSSEKPLYLLQKDDVLIMEGGTAGTSCIYNNEFAPCYIQNSVHRCRAINNNISKYLYYWMHVVFYSGYINSICNKATILHYTKEKVEKTPIVLPSIVEQKSIVNYLDSKCSEIDALLQNYEDQITTLEEYKKSLIYEYVTGKKEVPAA